MTEDLNALRRDMKILGDNAWYKTRPSKIISILERTMRAERAIVRVREIHSPKSGERPVRDSKGQIVDWEKYTMCQGCSADYPCATIMSLGVTEDFKHD